MKNRFGAFIVLLALTLVLPVLAVAALVLPRRAIVALKEALQKLLASLQQSSKEPESK